MRYKSGTLNEEVYTFPDDIDHTDNATAIAWVEKHGAANGALIVSEGVWSQEPLEPPEE